MTAGRSPGPVRILATVALVVAVAGVRFALAVAGPAPARAGLVVDVAAAAAMALTARSIGRLPRDRRSRRAWALLTACPVAWAVAPFAWLVGAPPGVAHLARGAAVLLVAGSWWCAARAGGTLSRVRPAIDGGIGAAAVLVVAWHGPLGAAWLRAGGGAEGTAVVGLPVLMVGAATLGAAITVTEMPAGRRVRPLLFVAALLALAASDVSWALGGPPLWAVGWTAYALAMRMQLGLTPRVSRLPTRGRQVWLPYAFITPAVTVLAVQARTGGARPAQVGAGLAIVALLVARQHVTLLENDRLVARLEQTERLLRHRATHDSLTGLPGRAALHEHLAALAARDSAGPRPLALAFVDVDWFKAVNDRYGHAAGDAVLVEVAHRLTAALPIGCPDAFAARLGGDEFALVVVGDAAADPARLTAALTAALDGPVQAGETALPTAVSVGVAVVADGPFVPSALLHEADLAMYAVKRARPQPAAPHAG